jgi:hypothetical protein
MIKQTTSRVIFFPRTLTSGEEYVNEEQWQSGLKMLYGGGGGET